MPNTQPASNIKFITDTACDIPDDLLLEYDIDMLSVPIAIDGREYFERRSFTILEFYRLLAKSSEIPTTSRVPQNDYENSYERAYRQGFTDIINVTINGKGSGTIQSAQMARDSFFEKNPDAKNEIKIHIIDSKTYTMAYGYPIIEGAKMAREGKKTAQEIVAYLKDFFSTCVVYLACFSLEYAKKSGRISAAAAFIGDVLGLRPIISFVDGETKIVEKVRGEKMLLTNLMQVYEKNRDPSDSFAMVICGEIPEYGAALQQALQERLGVPVPIYNAGASIVINSGPKVAAIVCRGKKRR